MMKRIKWLSLIAAMIFICVFFFGCAAPSARNMSETQAAPAAPAAEAPAAVPAPTMAPAMESEMMYDAAAEESGFGYSGGGAMPQDNVASAAASEHKIIYNADLSLTTRQFDSTLAYIENKIAALGGHIAQSSLQGKKPEEWNDQGRTAYLQARIPAAKSEEFLRDVQGEADVESLNRSSEDITSQFIDTQSRVEVLRIQLQRLKDILITRDKLADVLELEREISRITMEIEQLTTNLKQWDNLVQYATISVMLREITELTAPRPIATDLGTRIRDGFFDSITGVGRFLGDVLVWLIAALPVLVLLGVIGVAVWLIIRHNVKKSASKRKANEAMREGYYKAYLDRFGSPPPPGSVAPQIEPEENN